MWRALLGVELGSARFGGRTIKPPGELKIQRIITHEFILADYVDIILHTRDKPTTGPNRGVLVDGPDRRSQRFRLIPQAISPQAGARFDATEQGTNEFDQVLMGEWDSEMELYDWWKNEYGQLYEITKVLSENGYERKGLLSLFNRSK